jgi:hypothetical protein
MVTTDDNGRRIVWTEPRQQWHDDTRAVPHV